MWDILGETYNDQGHLEKAEKMYQQGLEGRETMLGLKHPDTLACINHLDPVLERQERYEKAEGVHWHHSAD